MDTTAAQLVGAVFNGRWRLTRLLGEGGMGAVYEAQSTGGEATRALKVLHPEFVHEEQVLSRFLAEAKAAQSLEHPNVARVFESAKAEDGTPYLIMELLTGTPLATYLERGQALPPAQTVHIGKGILEALKLAHARRIVHRDLKPDNLFLVPDGRGSYGVKVLDFGIAKVMDAAGGMGSKTRTGVLLGTPGYMSPEQIKNSKGVDPRSDLWSVGIILYELLTTKEPFPADNEFARLTAVLTEQVTPIESVAPALANWSGFFQRALAKDPGQRFQSADEMAQALVAVGQGGALPAGHATTTSPSGVGARQPSAPPPTGQAPMQSQGMQSHGMQAASMQQPPTIQGAYPPPQVHIVTPSYAPQPGGSTPPDPTLGAGRGGVNTHVSQLRPEGTPTLSGHEPNVQIVDAPPAPGPPWWLVALIGLSCMVVGFVLGLLVAR